MRLTRHRQFFSQENGSLTRHTRSGFSLVEVIAVLLLLAMLAGTAALAMEGRAQQSRAEDILAALTKIDQHARHHAAASGDPITLTIDTQTDTLTLTAQTDTGPVHLDTYTLPGATQIKQAWLLRHHQQVSRPQTVIAYRPNGSSPTFGLTLQHEHPHESPTTTEMLFAGLSGQQTIFDDENHLQDILAPLTGHNAD